MNWNEKNLLKEIDRLKVKLNNKTTYTKSIEKKAYNLSVENEFLKNRIAINKANGISFTQLNALTKEERVELLEKVRAFKASVVSFIDNSKNNKKEEKKDVELIKGKWYFCHDVCFRYKHTEVGNFDNKIHFLSLFDDVNIYNGDYFFENKDWEIIEATTEQIKKGITLERENGYFWNDEKQDFLKLEDVYFEAESREDLHEIIKITPTDLLSKCFDTDMVGNLVIKDEIYGIKNVNDICIDDYIEATKEVFIKLLKNYKG